MAYLGKISFVKNKVGKLGIIGAGKLVLCVDKLLESQC